MPTDLKMVVIVLAEELFDKLVTMDGWHDITSFSTVFLDNERVQWKTMCNRAPFMAILTNHVHSTWREMLQYIYNTDYKCKSYL